MRLISSIVIITCLSCSRVDTKSHADLSLTGFWVSKNLEHYSIDSAVGGGQTIYGSGYLLKLDSNGVVTSLSADFRWENDSLYQGGEPGMTLRIGQWQLKDKSILLNQRLVFKTIMLTSDRIGQLEVDSVSVNSEKTLIYRQDTLIKVKTASKELETFIEGMVTFYKNRNGM